MLPNLFQDTLDGTKTGDQLNDNEKRALDVLTKRIFNDEIAERWLYTTDTTSFNSVAQGLFDESARQFLEIYSDNALAALEPITVFLDDPKFPNTTLGEDEWENAETLANWISIDIFGNYVGKEAVLTDQEKNVLDIVAVEFFGSEEAFDRFMNGTAYNEAEQKELDAAVRSFLERYPVRDDPKLQIQPFD